MIAWAWAATRTVGQWGTDPFMHFEMHAYIHVYGVFSRVVRWMSARFHQHTCTYTSIPIGTILAILAHV